jgi:beta-N-acetylhexosaminidase
MMIGHAHYPCFDAEKNPASLSTAVIRDCLRGELGFDGLVMTDDLDMGAILNTFSWDETIRRAVRAGNDFIMICHRLEAAEDALRTLESMTAAELDPALENLGRIKQRLAPPESFSIEAHQALDQQVRQLRIDTLGEASADEQSPENAARSPVEDY